MTGKPARRTATALAVTAFVIVIRCGGDRPADAPQGPHFVGTVQAEWSDDGRTMTLLADFSYVDPQGETWPAPAGCVIDGASIPRPFWTFPGGPFSGLYRKASVVHDIACNKPDEALDERCWGRTRPYRAAHRMFYDAMLTSGVGPVVAKLMYWAVRVGGPTWDESGAEVASALDEEDRTVLMATAARLYEVLDTGPESRSLRLAAVDTAYRDRLVARGVDSVPQAGRFELFTRDARKNLAVYSRVSTPVDRMTKTYAVARAIAGEDAPSIEEIEKSLDSLLER